MRGVFKNPVWKEVILQKLHKLMQKWKWVKRRIQRSVQYTIFLKPLYSALYVYFSSQYLTFPDDDVESVAMSGYSDYIMSASSSIADIVNNASSAAASAAGQVAYQVKT